MVAISNQRDSFADIPCGLCGRFFTVMYNNQDMTDWLSGSKLIQNAFPYMTAGERELLLSNTCSACFDALFADLDNQE